jgi:hypothetical protein
VISAWVKGYVSGFTRGTNGPQIAAVPEGAVVVAYLDKFCRDNPLKFIGNGAFELVRDLGGKPR